MANSISATRVASKLINKIMYAWVLPLGAVICFLACYLYVTQLKTESRIRLVAIQSTLQGAIKNGDEILVRRIISSLNADRSYSEVQLFAGHKSISWTSIEMPYSMAHANSLVGEITFESNFDIAGLPGTKLVFEKRIDLRTILLLIISIFLFGFVTFKILNRLVSGIVNRLVEPIELFARELQKATSSDSAEAINGVNLKESYSELDHAIHYVKEMAIQVQLLEREKAQISKEVAVTELSRTVAHDIRSPLTAIAVGVSRLRDVDPALFALISAANLRLQEIAANLLTNKVAKGELHVDFNRSNVSETSGFLLSQSIESVINEKKLEFECLDVSFITDFNRYSGEPCQGSRVEFERVLSNLINNSVEALRNHGFVKLTLYTANGHHQIKIEDNGRGIPRDLLHRVGENQFSFGKAGGNGIGIFSAKQIVRSMNGQFEISSLENVGTKISISLPA